MMVQMVPSNRDKSQVRPSPNRATQQAVPNKLNELYISRTGLVVCNVSDSPNSKLTPTPPTHPHPPSITPRTRARPVHATRRNSTSTAQIPEELGPRRRSLIGCSLHTSPAEEGGGQPAYQPHRIPRSWRPNCRWFWSYPC